MSTPDISLSGWLARRAEATPGARALTFEGSTITYAQLVARIDRLAGGLRDRGVRVGDRIAFLGLNQPAFLETMFAASPAGRDLRAVELPPDRGGAGVHPG